MVASEKLSEAQTVERTVVEPNKKLIGPKFKTNQKVVIQTIESLNDEETTSLKTQLEKEGKATIQAKNSSSGESFEITSDLVSFSFEKKTIMESKYIPSVIEPSYGIGRIIYAVLEHAFSQRSNDEQRCVMAFKPCVAPVKVGIYRLINHGPFDPIVEELKSLLQGSFPFLFTVSFSLILSRWYLYFLLFFYLLPCLCRK
jgi:glycyl-tRNA synthetase